MGVVLLYVNTPLCSCNELSFVEEMSGHGRARIKYIIILALVNWDVSSQSYIIFRFPGGLCLNLY